MSNEILEYALADGQVRPTEKKEITSDIRIPCPVCSEGTIPLPQVLQKVLDQLSDQPITTREIARRLKYRLKTQWPRETAYERLSTLRLLGLAATRGRLGGNQYLWIRSDPCKSTK